MSERGSERGGGRLAGALARRSGTQRQGTQEAAPGAGGQREGRGLGEGREGERGPGTTGPLPAEATAGGVPPGQGSTGRKVGKRSDPAYGQALAHVRKVVHERVMDRALKDPGVKVELLGELDARGIEHRPGRAEYSDLVELLLLRWLESVGHGFSKRTRTGNEEALLIPGDAKAGSVAKGSAGKDHSQQ